MRQGGIPAFPLSVVVAPAAVSGPRLLCHPVQCTRGPDTPDSPTSVHFRKGAAPDETCCSTSPCYSPALDAPLFPSLPPTPSISLPARSLGTLATWLPQLSLNPISSSASSPAPHAPNTLSAGSPGRTRSKNGRGGGSSSSRNSRSCSRRWVRYSPPCVSLHSHLPCGRRETGLPQTHRATRPSVPTTWLCTATGGARKACSPQTPITGFRM